MRESLSYLDLLFAVNARVNVDALQNHIVLSYTTIGTQNCAVNMRSVDLGSRKVYCSSTVST